MGNPYLEVYNRLFDRFGPQNWWPAETPFEVMVGAVLVQNTAWTNVEQAIGNLKRSGQFDAAGILDMPDEALAERIRPAGYFNVKTRRLKALFRYVVRNYGSDVNRMRTVRADVLRSALLEINGIGPETADCILLYALDMPSFVVDAYSRRIFGRLGLVEEAIEYHDLKAGFEAALPVDVQLYNEYHALIVALGKDFCKPRPKCVTCPLKSMCAFGTRQDE